MQSALVQREEEKDTQSMTRGGMEVKKRKTGGQTAGLKGGKPTVSETPEREKKKP